MARKALIVSGAAGPQDIANAVLHRFGFAPAESAMTRAAATVIRESTKIPSIFFAGALAGAVSG